MSSELDRRSKRPARPSSRPPARPSQGNSVEFVRRELNDAEKQQYRSWRDDIDVVINELDRLLQDGYKISLKFDDYSSAYATFIFAPDDSDNAGYCLTGRGGNSYRALSEALFKHVSLLSGNWLVAGRTVDAIDDPDW